MNINQRFFSNSSAKLIITGFVITDKLVSKDGLEWVAKSPASYRVDLEGIEYNCSRDQLLRMIDSQPERVSTTLYKGCLSIALDPVGFEVP